MSLSTSFQKVNTKRKVKEEQQAAVVHLGELALSDSNLSDVMAYAAVLVTQVLPVEYSLIWELLDDEKNVLFMAGEGFKDRVPARVHIPLLPNSLERFTLASQAPIIVENLAEEIRFKPSHLLLDHGALSGISVLIGPLENPYAIFEVFSRDVKSFSENDVACLQSIANVIGLVMRQLRLEEDLVRQNEILQRKLIRAQFMTPSGHFEWDRYEIKNRLIESRERERLRLAQDLHDSPIQDLYGLIYQLDDLRDLLQNSEGLNIVDEFRQTLQRVVSNLRTTCRELRPPSLSPFGLEVAIRDHVEKFFDQNLNITVHLDLIQDKQVLSDSVRLSLFRIYQQAIHNVARHAQATEVHLRFHWDDEMIILEIEDNGKGFEVPKQWVELVREEHFGLLGIVEQVESMRGKLEILSAPGNGTLLRVLIPRS